MRKFIISNSKNVNETIIICCVCVFLLFGIYIADKQNKAKPKMFILPFCLTLALLFQGVRVYVSFSTKYHGNSSISPVICPFLFNRLELSTTASHRSTNVHSALVLAFTIFLFFSSHSSIYKKILYFF